MNFNALCIITTMYRIGVDVGGTNTDAALLDTRSVSSAWRGILATCKAPTTSDVTTGIKRSVDGVLQKSNISRDDVVSVAVGTTQFVNAVVEADAERLCKVRLTVSWNNDYNFTVHWHR